MEFEKLKQIVAEILSVDPRELTEETNFIDDLCADSLDLYQVIQEIEGLNRKFPGNKNRTAPCHWLH